MKPVRVPEAKAVAVRNVWLRSLRADQELENAAANAPVLTAEYAFDRPDLATEPIGDIVPEGIRPPSLHTTRAKNAKAAMAAKCQEVFAILASSRIVTVPFAVRSRPSERQPLGEEQLVRRVLVFALI